MTTDVPPEKDQATDVPPEKDQGAVESTAAEPTFQSEGQDHEGDAGLDLPAIRETIEFAKTGRLNPNPPKKIPKFSANRVKPLNRKAHKFNCYHVKTCKECQDWAKGIVTDHTRGYHRQYRIIKRAEETAAVMTKYTRDLQRQNEQLKSQNEELKKKNDRLQKRIEELSQ